MTGIVEFGKTQVAFHSDILVGGAVLGSLNTNPKNSENIKDEIKTMKNTKIPNNDAKKMSSKTESNATPWWMILFLVAPLV